MPIQIASNDKGDQVALINNQWMPVQKTATNDKGQNAYLINNEWVIDQPEQAEKPARPMTVGQGVGLTGRGISPYMTAATAGAAVGLPLGVPELGAGAGVATLGLTDLGTNAYNAIANYTKWPRVKTGSEMIADMYGFPKAETPNQQMYVNALQAATGAGSQAVASGVLAGAAQAGSTTQRVLTDLSRQPIAQAAGSVTASTAIDKAREEGVDNPVLLAVLGTAAGVVGGGIAGAVERGVRNIGTKPATIDSIRNEAKQHYQQVDDAGVIFNPASYSGFLNTLEQQLTNAGFNPNAHTAVAGWVSRLERSRANGSTLTELDAIRSEATKALGAKPDVNTRRLLQEFKDSIDDYVTNAGPNDVSTGNLPQAQASLGEARRLWTSVSKAEKIEELLRRASLQEGSQSQAIRNEFRSLALNQKRMRQFSPIEREFIESVAKGRPLAKALEWFGDKTIKAGGILAAGGTANAAVHFVPGIDPTTGLVVGGGMMGVGAGMKGTANMMTRGQARNLQRMTLGESARSGMPRNALLSPAIQASMSGAGMDPMLAAALGYPQGQ